MTAIARRAGCYTAATASCSHASYLVRSNHATLPCASQLPTLAACPTPCEQESEPITATCKENKFVSPASRLLSGLMQA